MALIFGLDIGTTSIGFAVIDHDVECSTGRIRRLGVRIFPEARDSKGIPLNQERRQARQRRRQLRRRRERRRLLQDVLLRAGLLPSRQSPGWDEAMKHDPYKLRGRAFDGETLTPHEIGRAIYHLAQRRHFKGRAIDEIADDVEPDGGDADEKRAASARDSTVQALKDDGRTLGAWLAGREPHMRKRGTHASRDVVEDEFDRIWLPLVPERFRTDVRDAIFFQRPVFWRLNTLGECRLIPGAPLCPKGFWLSQQRRMLEKLNNLSLVGGNQRRIDEEERRAILAKLQTQESMNWGGVRRALAHLYRKRGSPGEEKAMKFNLEEGGERKLLGNAVEARLAAIFGDDWHGHPHKQEIRDSIPLGIWKADYEVVGGQRVVIVPAAERKNRRAEATCRLAERIGLSDAQAEGIQALKLPTGWEPYSIEALQAILPYLEAGVRFGEIINGPEWEEWRAATFPGRVQPTGEVVSRLPSPATREERDRMAGLRNPTVARTRNELRKVVNNLIDMFGKPDLIRVELARDVGNSKRRRDEMKLGILRQENRRKDGREKLQENGISEPSRADVEKCLLWEECRYRCPYTGDSISFDALFRTGEFEVEHIWPRSRSLDDSFRNKTLCRKDTNVLKGNQTPYEFFRSRPDEWAAVANRLSGMKSAKGGSGMPPGKIRRFLSMSVPDDFATRQLNDTGYAAREAINYLKKLWPDLGSEAPVKVHAVSGRITAHLRRLWGLQHILAETGEKTRADHRHHAIDALTVACCHPGTVQRLSRYWQDRDSALSSKPAFLPPWATIRSEAEQAVADIVVSHRVRRKVSGPLHKETIYGDTGKNDSGKGRLTYRHFVTRKNVEALSKSDLQDKNAVLWPDQKVRELVKAWVDRSGGDPKKAFPPYPKRSRKGPEIRKVRLHMKRQVDLMARVSTGYADLSNNHHIAIYRLPDGSFDSEVVSLFEASGRQARHEPVVRRDRGDGSYFVMSLSPGDSLLLDWHGKTRIRVVSSVWNSGQIVISDDCDATGTTESYPKLKTIVAKGGRKISVDPIGRIRPASD